MSRILKYCLLAVLPAVCWLLPASATADEAHHEGTGPLELIQADYTDGQLDYDQKAIYQIQAIKEPSALPAEYQVTDERLDSRGATIAILDVKQNWADLSDSTRTEISAMLSRQSATFSFVSLSGFFRLHYDTAGIDRVPATDDDLNGTPDYVERVAAYLDTSLQAHIDMGYRLPPSDSGLGGDDLFDVYFEDMPFYGYAVPEGTTDEPWPSMTSYLVMNNNFVGFPSNTDPEGDIAGAAKATAAHEFHHCVQFAYNPNMQLWYMEQDATCLEDLIYDHVNDNYNYLPSFITTPDKSLTTTTNRMYGGFVWPLFMVERYNTTLLEAFWDGARFDSVMLDVIDDTLSARHGTSVDAAFEEFAAWLYITGDRDGGAHFEEAAFYPQVPISDAHASYPVSMRTASVQPAGYGSAYVQFSPVSPEGNLELTFEGSLATTWAVYLVKSITPTQHELESVAVDPVTQTALIDLIDFSELYQSVTLVAINTDPSAPAASFNYAARLFGDNAVSSRLLTDSAVYVGAERQFDFLVINPSPLNDVYDVIYSDDSGWIMADTFDIFLVAGDSAVVPVSVEPPVGTGLGSVSTLYFKTVSRGDPLVFDEQFGTAETVLQRGDATFDGQVDISDLTHMISFLFLDGPQPLPVMDAGDYDCAGGVDVADLTAMIQRLFLSGPPSPCNPF